MKPTQFSNLPIKPSVLDNLASLNYLTMTPIQEKSLAYILNKRDLIAQAKTGSGKTAAFGIGLLSHLDPSKKRIQALVLCPTRELANQVATEIRRLARQIPNLKVLTLTGGTPLAPQAASLEHGAHCVVGTPGRVEDHLTKRTLDLRQVKTLVLDEADRMLDMGFAETLEKIVSYTPKDRQTLLFSATYPEDIKTLSQKFQRKTVQVKVDSEPTVSQIEQIFYEVDEDQKVSRLPSLLEHHLPGSTVIFCNTKQKCQDLAQDLRSKGFSCEALHGDLEQRERDEVLMLFANKSLSVLVATDVASRGLDIKDLEAVINFDLARQAEVHVHRIGRTGRAGKNGLALSLYSKKENFRVKALEEYQKMTYNKLNLSGFKFSGRTSLKAPMVSIRIAGGKKNKLRPTDILGALTKTSEIDGKDVGKINIFNFHSCVALAKEKVQMACDHLKSKPIKGKIFKVQMIN